MKIPKLKKEFIEIKDILANNYNGNYLSDNYYYDNYFYNAKYNKNKETYFRFNKHRFLYTPLYKNHSYTNTKIHKKTTRSKVSRLIYDTLETKLSAKEFYDDLHRFLYKNLVRKQKINAYVNSHLLQKVKHIESSNLDSNYANFANDKEAHECIKNILGEDAKIFNDIAKNFSSIDIGYIKTEIILCFYECQINFLISKNPAKK